MRIAYKIFLIVLILGLSIFAQKNPSNNGPAAQKDGKPNSDEWVQPPSVTHTPQQLEQQRIKAEKQILAQQEKLKQKSPQMKARIEEQQRIRAERTAKYKAEQARIKQLRNKQKQAAEKRRQQMGGQQQKKFQRDGNYEKTAKVRDEEKKKVLEFARSIKKKISTKSVMFEVGKKIQEFIINPSLDDQMMIRFRLYVEKENVFSQIKDVDIEQPLKVYVYEDNNRIVSQATFFFEQVLNFPVKASSVYVLRFYNSGSLKLVSMDYNHFITSEAAKNFYDSSKSKIQFAKAYNLVQGIKASIRDLQISKAMDIRNNYVLAEAMEKHYSLQILQIIVVGIVCIFQVKFIKKMFKSVSIL